MGRLESAAAQAEVLRTLRALGGPASLGDLVALVALPRDEVEAALEALIATERGHVRVSESGDVVYHLGERMAPPSQVSRLPIRRLTLRVDSAAASSATGSVGFDRKTLQLIRAREGVLSLAELVEHTGMKLSEAEKEMGRLAEGYGGVPHVGLDGHVIHAFPELMASAHGRFPVREPRPAWVRFEDPIRASRGNRRRESVSRVLNLAGLVGSVGSCWLLLDAGPAGALAGFAAAATGVVVFGGRLVREIGRHRLFRFRHPESLRRYALGHVIETALKGKGVVSLGRTVEYLQARAGRRRVSRSGVELALRELAREFGAPLTEQDGQLFFGFRNVKRQFLASEMLRRQIHLARTAHGGTLFDTADSPMAAAERDLEAFDLRLREGPIDILALAELPDQPPGDLRTGGP